MSGPLREGLLWLRMESDSDAVIDLAAARPVPPPSGVLRLDLRESTDVLVTERDARDPGVTSRILNGPFEGHGGILSDPRAIEQTVRTITERRVPAEDRGRIAILAAEEQSRRYADYVLGAVCVLAVVACASTFLARGAARPFIDLIGRFIPNPSRKPCP